MLGKLVSVALAATMVACGFDARPKSGTVVCKPQGNGCCPDGYLCVGRGGAYAGACWSKQDLPPAALTSARDHTPAIPNDPACLVTDWRPPLGGDGGSLDGHAFDSGPVIPSGTGGSGGGYGDAQPGWETAPDAWLGTDGSEGPPDVPVADPDVVPDVAPDMPPVLDALDDTPGHPAIDSTSVDQASDAPSSPAVDAADVPLSRDGGAPDGADADPVLMLDASVDLGASDADGIDGGIDGGGVTDVVAGDLFP